MLTPSPYPTRNKDLPRQPTIDLICGGGHLALITQPDLLRRSLVLLADVQEEILRVRPDPLPANLTTFPLATGHTAQTLSDRAGGSTQHSISCLASMNAAYGLGQWRGMGTLAFDDLCRTRTLGRFLEETLIDDLLSSNGGVLNLLSVVGKGGLSGGTASAALLELVSAVATAIISRSDAIVDVRLEMIGSISYAGLGPRLRKNAACGIVDAVAFVTAKDRHPREVRSLTLIELPPVGRDREARDRYMLEIEQGKNCEEVRQVLDQVAPNQALDSAFGNITLWRSDHFHHLDPTLHIAPDIFGSYAQCLLDVADEAHPDPDLVKRIDIGLKRAALPRQDLGTILAAAEGRPIQELADDIARPNAKLEVEVTITIRGDELLHPTEAAAVWASPPVTMQECRHRLALQRSISTALGAEIAAAQIRLRQHGLQRETLFQELHKSLAALRPHSPLARWRSALTSPHQRTTRLQRAASQLRGVADEIQKTEAILHALQRGRQQVDREAEYSQQRLTAIAARLKSAVPHSQRARTEPLVTPRDIDEVFPELWRITEYDDRQLRRTLVSCVKSVTLAGLATITAADPPRLEVVANQIAGGRGVAASAPPWGGKPSNVSGLKIHVIPPLTPETAHKLGLLIRDRDPQSVVVIAERMPASLNCVTLFIRTAESLNEDILTKQYQRALQDAYEDPNRHMYFPRGFQALEHLGISVNGEVRFADKNTDLEGDHHA